MDDIAASAAGLFDDGFDLISAEDIQAAQEAIRSGGAAAFGQFIKNNQNKWKETPLNVGFIGNSGTGKSSTINSVLGLKASDPGAAKVGTQQTTMEPTPYKHPANPCLKLWDLPGVGTPEFPRETYFDQIGFEHFDFFFILGTMRVRTEDIWIGSEIVNREKKFFYVRAMIDNDITNNEHDKGYSREQTLAEVRQNIVDNFVKQNLQHKGIYLISNRKLADFDFPDLMTDLLRSFPELKRSALALTLRAHTKEMLEEKAETLRCRIKWAAALSATAAVIPLPGLGIAADLAILANELKFYYEQLGLSTEALQELGDITGVDPQKLIETAAKMYPSTLLGIQAVKVALQEAPVLVAETALEEFAKYVPLIGSVISSSLSFATMTWYLHKSLTEMHQAATTVMSEALAEYVVASNH